MEFNKMNELPKEDGEYLLSLDCEISGISHEVGCFSVEGGSFSLALDQFAPEQYSIKGWLCISDITEGIANLEKEVELLNQNADDVFNSLQTYFNSGALDHGILREVGQMLKSKAT